MVLMSLVGLAKAAVFSPVLVLLLDDGDDDDDNDCSGDEARSHSAAADDLDWLFS